MLKIYNSYWSRITYILSDRVGIFFKATFWLLMLCVISIDALCQGEPIQLTDDGAWCWFSDPRAIYYEGNFQRTYAGWITSTGDVTVGFYDHQTGEVKSYVLHQQLEIDDHDNPSLVMTPEGKLMVFYSKHSKDFPIQMAKTVHPERIDEWEEVKSLNINDTVTYAGKLDSYTYTNPYLLTEENNRIHLFWRGMDFKPNYSFSEDGGVTWEKGKIFILPENIYRNRRPYLKVSSNGKNSLHFAFTDGHPRNEPTNSIYYAKYKGGNLYKASGEVICSMTEIPFEPRQADRVYDARKTKERAWIWDVAEDSSGNPVLVYVRFPDNQHHMYYYATWDGNTWVHHKITDGGGWFPQTPSNKEEREPNYSGGLVLDHENPSIVYLSRRKNGIFEIEKWETTDSGANWKTTPITHQSAFDQIRPFVIRNTNEDNQLQLMWLSNRKYIHYTNYDSSIWMN